MLLKAHFGPDGWYVGGSQPMSAIYHLIDPRDGSVRYVGKTKSPQSRLLGHCNSKDFVSAFGEKKFGRSEQTVPQWIASLREAGVGPMLRIIRWVDHAQAIAEEKLEIHTQTQSGALLLNRVCVKQRNPWPPVALVGGVK